MNLNLKSFWSSSTSELLKNLQSTTDGLTTEEAKKRLISHGANRIIPGKRSDAFALLVSQFKSPIILILIFATGLSFFMHDPVDASIILIIVVISGLLGFLQESKTNPITSDIKKNYEKTCQGEDNIELSGITLSLS